MHFLQPVKAKTKRIIGNFNGRTISQNQTSRETAYGLNGHISNREVNKNNLLGGQFLIFLPKNPRK